MKTRILTGFPAFFAVTLLFSCQSALMTLNGVRHPRTENRESIRTFAASSGLEFEPGIDAVSSYNQYFNNYNLFRINSIHVFSKNGYYIPIPASNSKCGPDLAGFLLSLNKFQLTPSSGKAIFNSFSERFLLPDGSTFNLDIPDTLDYICVISWSKWFGKKSIKREILPCLEAMKKNERVRFGVIFLNMDKQEIWGEENLSNVKLTRNSLNAF